MAVLLMLRSAAKDSLRLQRQGHFGAQSHTPRNSCVRFAAGVTAGLAQHSPPGGLLGLTCAGLSPADRASFLAHPLPALRIAFIRSGSAQPVTRGEYLCVQCGCVLPAPSHRFRRPPPQTAAMVARLGDAYHASGMA